MIILPAIDIIDGKPVRLYQGDYDRVEQVADNVSETAKRFEQSGASWVHMVDLDGAKAGHPVHQTTIIDTAKTLSIPVEVGGGIRTFEDAAAYLDGGVGRVILSTAAMENHDLIRRLCQAYPGKIAVGLDCRDGSVAISGWLEDSGVPVAQAAREMEALGVQTLIVTDISKDGTLSGPALQLMEDLQKETNCQLIASGGIRDLDHIRQLTDLDIYGAITGKAVYAGTLDLKEAIQVGNSSC